MLRLWQLLSCTGPSHAMRVCMDSISRARAAVEAGVVAPMACVGVQEIVLQEYAPAWFGVWGTAVGRCCACGDWSS